MLQMALNEAAHGEPRQSVHRTTYFSIADSILNGDTNGIYWNDRFVDLCLHGDTRGILELSNRLKATSSGFSLDSCHSKTGDTGLIAACKNRHYDAFELLLRLGADPTVRNASGESVLDFCTNDEKLKTLIQSADSLLPSSDKCTLTFSSWSGNVQIFNNCFTSADWDMEQIDSIRNANGMPLILLAVENIDAMSRFLKDSTSSVFNPEELVSSLINAGVDVNACYSPNGKAALHYLAQVNENVALNIMRQIIETRHADVSLRDSCDNMPLHYACGSANEAAAVLLLHEGSDVNARGQGGRTPLHFSANIGSQDLVRILLDCGADVTMIDDKGLTPFDVANDTVVRTSLREAWTEATARKRSSSDVESSMDEDGVLARSEPSVSLRSSNHDVTVVGKLRSIRSLPVLPSISPRSANSTEPVAGDSIITALIHQSTSDNALSGLAGIETLLDKHSSSRTTRTGSCKPRLRRWRSTSAGCAVTAGVKLPPLHMAVYEVGVSNDHKLQPTSTSIGRPQTTPELESTALVSTTSETPKPTANAKTKTLQTTMPCRVSVSTLMILGARPPQLVNDMSIESISARSTKCNVQCRAENGNSSCEGKAAETKPVRPTAAKKQLVLRNKDKPSTAECRSGCVKQTKSASANKDSKLCPRRHSITSAPPERVVTLKSSPPKEIPPLYSKYDFPQSKNLMDEILQPALKIEPIYPGNEQVSSDDERKSAEKSIKTTSENKPKKKKSSQNKEKAKDQQTNGKKAKKSSKSKTNSASNVKKGGDAKLIISNDVNGCSNFVFENGGGCGGEHHQIMLTMENGVSLRLPLDGEPEPDDDNNSLRALSDIIQLSTVVEEDELLASLRSSYSRMTPARLLQMPIISEPVNSSEPKSEDEQNGEASEETYLDDDEDGGDDTEENSDDAASVSTLTPEDDREAMERELLELGRLPENANLAGTMQPLCVDEDDNDANGDLFDDGDESARLVRASSRMSSSRNPVVFQEDDTLHPADHNDDLGDSFASGNMAVGVRATFQQDVQLQNENGDVAAGNNQQVEPPGVDNHQPVASHHYNSHSKKATAETPGQTVQRSLSQASNGSEALQQSIRWRKGNEIGHGGYGKVYLALTSLGGLIAVKQIDTSRYSRDTVEKEYDRIDEEINILRTLKHPGIVEFYGTSFEGDVVNIFMEFIAGGSIASLLKRFGPLEEPIFRRYTRQLLKAVKYLHSNGIVHRDIKGANIMVTGDGLIKLIDFGCARRLVESAASESSIGHDQCNSGAQLKSAKGTPYWMSPEVILETGHGRKSDIWSIGCTVHEMAMRKPPWAELEPSAAMFAIASGRKPVPQLPASSFSADACNFVAACLNRQPGQRPTAAELLEHHWFKSSAAHHRRQSSVLRN